MTATVGHTVYVPTTVARFPARSVADAVKVTTRFVGALRATVHARSSPEVASAAVQPAFGTPRV
jgi:hypothetical protein